MERKEEIEKQGEKVNKADNKEQDTLPYSSFQPAFFPPFHSSDLSSFRRSILPLLNHTGAVSILTGVLMEPERWWRGKEAREGAKSDGERQTDGLEGAINDCTGGKKEREEVE